MALLGTLWHSVELAALSGTRRQIDPIELLHAKFEGSSMFSLSMVGVPEKWHSLALFGTSWHFPALSGTDWYWLELPISFRY